MSEVLARYIPERALTPCVELIQHHGVHLKIVRERETRHGDYRRMPGGGHQITVNAMNNRYQFLITLIHEIAHLVAFELYGRHIKPHGPEWKNTFQRLMLPFLRPEIFPERLLPYLARHFKNPKASSSTETALSLALKFYDVTDTAVCCVYQIPEGSVFRIRNGRMFRRGACQIKRYQCVEVNTGKLYLFQPHAEVELIAES